MRFRLMAWEVRLIIMPFTNLEKSGGKDKSFREKTRVKNRVKSSLKGTLFLRYLNGSSIGYDKRIFEYMSLLLR